MGLLMTKVLEVTLITNINAGLLQSLLHMCEFIRRGNVLKPIEQLSAAGT